MYKKIMKLFLVYICIVRIIVAMDEQQLSSPQAAPRSGIIDSHLIDSLKFIMPLEIDENGQLNLSVKQEFTIGQYRLVCTMSTFDKFKNFQEQGFEIFYNGSSVLQLEADNTIYSDQIFLTQTYLNEMGSSLGPILRCRNLEQIEEGHRNNVFAILKRLFFNFQISSDVFLDANFFKQNGFAQSSGVILAPSFGNIRFDKRLARIYSGSLERMYPGGMWPEKMRITFAPLFDQIHRVLSGSEKLQPYQWCSLIKMMGCQIESNLHKEGDFFCLLYRMFTHETLYLLFEQGYRIDLENGGISYLKIPAYYQNGKEFKALQLSCYAKGGWILGTVSHSPLMMPDFFIDVRNQMNPGQYIYQTHNTPKGVKHTIISDKGIEEGDFLVVKRENEKTMVYHLGGLKSDTPFSVIQEQELDLSLGIEESIIPYPSDEKDLDVLSYLLSQMEQEEEAKAMEEEIQNLQKTEELPDDSLAEDERILFLQAQKAKQDQKIRKIQEEKQRKEAELKQMELLQREEAIKKIEEELFTKELYNQKVKKEQEARRLQVIKEAQRVEERNRAQKGKKGSKTVSLPSQNASASTIETEEQMRLRIRLQAEGIFNERCIKLKDVASRINSILKINPDARSILFRQSGSHLVADGASASSGPVTLVIPHGGDGALSKRSVNNFFERFIHLILSRR
jgi:hypothetical protein